MLWLQIAIVFLLILLNGFFALSEMAIVSSRQVRLQRAADLGRAGAKSALDLKRDPGRFLSTVQIGMTVIGVLASVFGGATFAGLLAEELGPYSKEADALSFLIVVVGISYLTIILGELVPKRIALTRPEAIAAFLAPLLKRLTRIAAPVVWFVSASSSLVLRLTRARSEGPVPITEEEITIMLREAQATGAVHAAETAIVQMALRLGDRRVAAVMTPRTQIEWLDLSDGPEDNRALIAKSHHSRFPVFDGGPDQVVGIVLVKDMLAAEMTRQPFDLTRLVRPALYIPETATALRLLEVFRKSGDQMALVIDEFGDFQGIVTVHDIMQSLVGDIAAPGETPSAHIARRDDGSFIADGMTPLDEVRDAIGIVSPRDDEGGEYHTLGGFVMAHLHRVPAVGNSIAIGGFRYEVLAMAGRRVDKVLIAPAKAGAKDG